MRKVILWLGAAVLLAWGGSLHVPYHFDDSHSVEGNAAIRSLSNIPKFWIDPRTSTSISENRVYRPLLYTFYSVCWWMGDGATWPFHLMKMLMHLLTSIAVYLIWKRLFNLPGWMPEGTWKIRLPLLSREHKITAEALAFFTATLFAIHPAASECVVYISSTTSMQAAMFLAWGFWFHLRSKEDKRVRWFFLSLFFYFLSVASKEIGITLVALIFWSEFFISSGSLGKRLTHALRETFPHLILGIVLMTWFLMMRPESGDVSRGWISSTLYFVSQWRAWLYYARIWFWPFDLNADHAGELFAKTIADSFVIQAFIGNALLLFLAFIKRKTFPAFGFGLIWFYIALSPDSSVVVLGEAIAERRMYASYIAFAGGVMPPIIAFLGWVFAQPLKRPVQLGWVSVLVVMGFLVGAHARVEVWSTGENLWKDTVEKNPTSGRAMNNLALVYMGRGQFHEAINLLERCERHWANWSNCPLNRAISLGQLGKYEDAKKAFERALSLDPKSSANHFFYASFVEGKLNDPRKALEHYLISDQVTGGVYTAAKINAARMHMKLNQWMPARKLLQDTLEYEPTSELARRLLQEVEKHGGH